MILLIIIGIVVLAIAFVHYQQGLFSATLSAILAIICAAFAVSFHETLIESLLGGAAANIAHGMILMLLFAGSYSILRGIFDKCIPGQTRLPFLVDKIGGAVMGLVAGSYAAGIVLIAAQELPFGPTIMGYARYDTESDRTVVLPQPNHAMSKTEQIFDELKSESPGVFDDSTKHTLYFDDLVVNTVAYLSNGGSLAGSQPLTAIHPDLLQEVMGQRLGIEPGAKRVAMNLPAKKLQDVKVIGLFSLSSIPQADAEIDKWRPSFTNAVKTPRKPAADSIMLVVRTVFSHTAADPDGLVRLSTGAVRLVAPTDADATHFADYYPLGTLQGASMLYLNKLDDPIFVNVREGDDQAADFVFMVKKEGFVDAKKKVAAGSFLEVKRLARGSDGPDDQERVHDFAHRGGSAKAAGGAGRSTAAGGRGGAARTCRAGAHAGSGANSHSQSNSDPRSRAGAEHRSAFSAGGDQAGKQRHPRHHRRNFVIVPPDSDCLR